MKPEHIKLLIAGFVLLIGLSLLYFHFKAPSFAAGPGPIYFDLTTSKLFSAAQGQPLAPIAAPSGPAADGKFTGVRAYVFSCGSCTKEADRTVGWLEMFTDKGKADLGDVKNYDEMGDVPTERYMHEMMVRKPDEKDWVRADTTAATAIQQVPICPDSSRPHSCGAPDIR